MNFLLINSNENDAFAAVYFEGTLDAVKCSEFAGENEKPGRSPDKLINSLVKLRGKYDFTKLDAISVTIGPGSFTGIRVGLSFAKGIAGGLDIPLIPVNNFDLLYSMVKDKNPGSPYCVMLPGKSPEFYYAVIRNGSQEKIGCLNFEEILKILEKNTILVGNFGNESLLKHSYFAYINLNSLESAVPGAMLELSKQYFTEGKALDAENAEPVYLKDFIVK